MGNTFGKSDSSDYNGEGKNRETDNNMNYIL